MKSDFHSTSTSAYLSSPDCTTLYKTITIARYNMPFFILALCSLNSFSIFDSFSYSTTVSSCSGSYTTCFGSSFTGAKFTGSKLVSFKSATTVFLRSMSLYSKALFILFVMGSSFISLTVSEKPFHGKSTKNTNNSRSSLYSSFDRGRSRLFTPKPPDPRPLRTFWNMPLYWSYLDWELLSLNLVELNMYPLIKSSAL